MRPQDAARYFRGLDSKVSKGAERGVKRAQRIVLNRAKLMSSGFETQVDHNRADNPYARRHGSIKAPADPVIINAQSAEFLQSWDESPVYRTPDGIEAVVYNDDEKAEWLEKGTPTMLGRPLPETVEEVTKAECEQVIQEEIARAL